jgi:hypothetical protein
MLCSLLLWLLLHCETTQIKAMKKKTSTLKKVLMKVVKFFLAAVAGFGLVKLFGFIAESELEEVEDIYNDEEYPLFV